MAKVIDEWLGLAVIVAIMMLCIFNLPLLTKEWGKPLSDAVEDKSTVPTEMSLYLNDTVQTGEDVLMMMVVTDEYVQFPRSIKINNNPIVDIDNSWLAYKNQNLSKMYIPVANGGQGLCDMLDWTVTEVTYEPNGGDPYWHITLENI